ncbi:MAG: VOC family protein [Acidobacteriota bacterium]
MPTINPYLNFNGNCEEAMEFYRSVFGGEYTTFSRFGDMDTGMPMDESEKDNILHASLPIGESYVLMASDCPSSMMTVTQGNAYSISIGAESEEDATRLFNGLSAGGNVTMPLQKTFWGAFFGMFVDKFGVNWMVNYDYNRPE